MAKLIYCLIHSSCPHGLRVEKSLKRLNFPEYKVEIKSIEKAKNTPSSKWEQQRKKDIEKFKKEIINSDLLANLKNNFGEDIDEDKIMVIDHEE